MGEVAEHDYATYIIEQAMESGENQVVIQMEELVNAEDIFQLKTDAESSNSGDQNTVEIAQLEDDSEMIPSYRSESARSTSGYWSEADVHRLLKIYIKHLKKCSYLNGRPINFVWDKIIKEFDPKNRFSRHQVKTKIQRLKNSGRIILANGQELNSKWPFLKSVVEILKMEDGGTLRVPGQLKYTGSPTWSSDETEELLACYKKYSDRIARAKTQSDRRLIWNDIAKEVNRPRFDVQLKFQSLKASWKRCCEGVMQTSWPYFDRMQELMDKEKNKLEARDEWKDSSSADKDNEQEVGPTRWDKEETTSLLELYKDQLQHIKATKQIMTKRQVYRLVADSLGISLANVQIKVSSLKTHWKKHGRQSAKRWPYFTLMQDVVKLENSIWVQGEEVDDVAMEDDQDIHASKSLKDLPEPVWLWDYRQQLQKRHEESMEIRQRMLDVLERLLTKTTTRQNRQEFIEIVNEASSSAL